MTQPHALFLFDVQIKDDKGDIYVDREKVDVRATGTLGANFDFVLRQAPYAHLGFEACTLDHYVLPEALRKRLKDLGWEIGQPIEAPVLADGSPDWNKLIVQAQPVATKAPPYRKIVRAKPNTRWALDQAAITAYTCQTIESADTGLPLVSTEWYEEAAPIMRAVDLFAPQGKGQGTVVFAEPDSGKTTVSDGLALGFTLLSMAEQSNGSHGSNTTVIYITTGERPDEGPDVVEKFAAFKNVLVFFSDFYEDRFSFHQMVFELAIAHATWLVRYQGQDVVVICDSLSRVAETYNALFAKEDNIPLSGGMLPPAKAKTKKVLGCFGRVRNGKGSITFVGTVLKGSKNKFMDVTAQELEGTGNSNIFLLKALADAEIFPAIALDRSRTRNEKLIRDPRPLAAIRSYFRKKQLTTQQFIGLMQTYATNEELVSRAPADIEQRLRGASNNAKRRAKSRLDEEDDEPEGIPVELWDAIGGNGFVDKDKLMADSSRRAKNPRPARLS